MTLEEAIAHYLKIAEENEKDAEQFKRIKATQDMISHCYECAEEHRQLAEWLTELKASLEAEDYCEKYCDNKKPLCWYRWAKAKVREVKADDDD